MKKAWLLGVALLAAGGVAAQAPPPGARPLSRPPCEAVGDITFLDEAGKRLGIRDDAGRIKTFTVDEAALPRWTKDLQVGERVKISCRDTGEEDRRPIASQIKPVGKRGLR